MGRLLLGAHVLVYAAVIVGGAILAWGLLRGPMQALRDRLARETSDDPAARGYTVPGWTAVVGVVLSLIFAALTVSSYFGVSLPVARVMNAVNRVRTVQLLAEPGDMRVVYVGDAPVPIRAGVRISTGPGNLYELVTRNDVVLVGSTGELFHVMPEGSALRLTGVDGQRVRVANLGSWDQLNRTFTGLDAVFTGGRWLLDESVPRASNPNSDFRIGTEADPIPGYEVAPADAGFNIRYLDDPSGSGPFVRITATRQAPYLQLTARQPLAALDGPPVMLRAQVRAHSAAGRMSLILHDVVSESGRVLEQVVRREPAAEWTTLVARAPRVAYPSPDDYVAVGLVRVSEGDWFDVRELGLFVGAFPAFSDELFGPAD